MNLDEANKQKVAGWLEEGLKLSDIQKRLQTELGINVTYMELRFLLDDLKLKPKEKEKELPPAAPARIGEEGPGSEAASTALKPPVPEEGEEEELPEPDDTEAAPAGAGKVAVTVDRIARPGALVSGNVTFTDGKSAQWYLDQMGRLGIVAKEQGYRPPQSDLMAFQTQLQQELAKLGF